MKKFMKNAFIATAFILSGIMISCGSTPKREMKITLVYSTATEMLESANSSILSGDYEKATYFLTNAYNQAMTIDNYELLTSICLANVSLSLSYNPPLIHEAEKQLAKARIFAKHSSDAEKSEALCTLSEVRIQIKNEGTDLSRLLEKLEKNEKYIKDDKYASAQFSSAHGDIYKAMNNYSQAEAAYEQAAKLYTDNRYLAEIGITWYKIAQVRSLNNKKQNALDALDKAIFYDREAENTLALGTDYYVKGIILLKGNPTVEEKAEAKFAFEHSADIFSAAGNGMEEMAAKSRKAAEEI